MQTSDISLWGTAVLMLLTGIAAGLFLLIDRRLGMRLGQLLLVSTLQMAVIGGMVWGVFYLDAWWADVVWFLLMVVAASLYLTRQLRLGTQRLFFSLFAALFVAVLSIGACLLWVLTVNMPYLSHHLLVSVVGLLLGHLLLSVRQGLFFYLVSLRCTTVHRQYLLSCGASHLESIMPSVRRSLRAAVLPSLRMMASPAIVSLPLIFCGMLLCGSSPVAAVVIVWLFAAAFFTSTVIALIAVFYLADSWLFDKQGNLLVGN